MPTLRLRTKVLLGAILLILLVGAAIVALTRAVLPGKLLRQVEQNGVLLAVELARDAVNPLLTENYVALQLSLNERKAFNEDAAYLYVLDQEGVVRAHTFPGGFPAALRGFNVPPAGGGHALKPFRTQEGMIYDIAAPIAEGSLGVVHVGIGEARARRGVGEFVRLILGIVLMACLLGGAAAAFLGALLTRPLERLTELAEEVGGGDLSGRVRVGSGDEMGRLAATFNRMVDELAEDRRRRERLEAVLRDQEERYRILFSSGQDAVFVHGLTADGLPGTFTEVNEAAWKRYGYTREEILKLSPLELDDAARRPDPQDVVRRLREARHLLFETVHRTKDGRGIPVEVNAHLFSFEGQSLVLSVARDISERKETEEMLRQAAANLERQNQELKKLDEIKDTLIRDLSHELKTPVAKQAMQLEILEGELEAGGASDRVRHILDGMQANIRRQEHLIRNVLDLSRLEAGGPLFCVEPVALDLLLTEVLADYQHAIEARHATVDTDLRALTLQSDRTMLWHVFSNLVNNAIKFLEPDTPGRIRVALAGDARVARVTVADNGIGMTEEERRRAFERFYRGSHGVEGTGVGLTICRRIVTGLRGTIRLESAGRGKGTAAVVELPLDWGGAA